MNDIIKQDMPFDIKEIEKKMLQFDQVECPVIHRFGPGLYIREVRIPAGTLAIGHRQRYEHMNLFLQGRLTMLNEDGSKVELRAPMIFTGQPGRKVGYIHEDMVWLNIYATDETDVEALEAKYIDKSEVWKENEEIQHRLKIGKYVADVEDYKNLLSEFGFTEAEVRSQTENEADQIDLPRGDYKFFISSSNIEGKGVFASAKIVNDELIGPARINGKRTPLGRYVNHSLTPNAKMVSFNGDIHLIAVCEIVGCKGGYAGDEITTDYRKNLKLIGAKSCQQ